ncbi:amino acid ABC transporter permease [Arthrobacter sp. SDTb3-6]|uniref:amino acid ABC transporter permease n=1 Tax=Arthrobacter sp. SDTb3-6 TaxID=2713571 RepID=UPI00159DF341|nr:amino acid ABC transporter permease [Arthrobacter sp. SDTb3-6]NVN00036.1 amino acid ABC transporter permease [Arthrobacter sp. SDTb3-6]
MDVIVDNFDLFAQGWLRTVQICFYALLGALPLGILLAAARVSPVPFLRSLGGTWVTIFMSCPLTVVLFFMAFGLPEIGIKGSYFWFGTIGLALYSASFVCEALRSGINAVPAGQAEAARSIGLSFMRSLNLVILPQALRSSLPPMTNAIIYLIKNSAIVGAFGVGQDLFAVADTLTAARGLSALPVLTGVIAGYLLLVLPIGRILSLIETKVAILR